MSKKKAARIAKMGNSFAGFDNWIEIFRGGQQTDSAGNPHDGDVLIEKALGNFDPSYHEAPAVLGHPTDDAPAYGWVADVKSEVVDGTARLFAKFKDVVPEFEEMVKAGRFKKRSASFYPDGRLRHVGWLGAMPPAVKGLADVAFSDADAAVTFDFIEPSPWTWGAITDVFRNLREWLLEKHGKETADAVVPEWRISDLVDEQNRALSSEQPGEVEEDQMKFSDFLEAFKFWKKIQDNPDVDFAEPAPGKQTPGASFSEADMAAAKVDAAKQAKKEAKAEAAAEFAETESTRKKAEAKARVDGIISGGIENGTIAPAWKDMGMAQFMEELDCEKAVSFAEGGEKQTGLDWFCDFLDTLPKLVNFSEVATRGKDVQAGDAGTKLEALVLKKREADKTLSYGAAFSEVQREHRDLAAEYAADITG
jgi:hypothetical protein